MEPTEDTVRATLCLLNKKTLFILFILIGFALDRQKNKAAGTKLTLSQNVQHINAQKAVLNNKTSFPHAKLRFAAVKLPRVHRSNEAKG